MSGLINIIGICVVAFFSLFILKRKEKRAFDYFLLLFNLLFMGFLYSDIWIKEEINTQSFIFQSLITFWIFPAFMTYGMLLIDEEHTWKKQWWWIWSFALTFTVFILVDFNLHQYTQSQVESLYTDPPLRYLLFYKTHQVFIFFALIWMLRKLNIYQHKLLYQYSDIESLELQWLKNFIYIYIVLNIVNMISFLAYNFGWLESIDEAFLILNISLVIALFYLSYQGIRQYSVANFVLEQIETESPQKASITDENIDEESRQIYADFLELLEGEQLYKEPRLQIQDAAQRLNVSVSKLSKAINLIAKIPFYEIVNQYRVENLKDTLTDKYFNKMTILALGFESGFNSKASLNRIFKQQTGMTPKEYQKSHLT